MHPIVAQIGPNEEQQPAVLARGRDVVVTAGAGTGKTRTLVARYLSLLAEGTPLRSIVAITFTRKAAREMRNRIREELQRYLASASLSLEERRYWDEIYSLLDAARIGTIHNLCTEMLRAHPAEMGLDPRFDVLEEGLAGVLVRESIDEALAWAMDDEAAVALFAFLGEWNLRAILNRLMRQRPEARAALIDLPEPLWPAWEARIVKPIRQYLDDPLVRAGFADLQALAIDGTLARALAQGDRLAEPLRDLLTNWAEIESGRKGSDWPAVAASLGPLRGNMKLVGRQATWAPADPKAVIGELRQRYDEQLSDLVGKGLNLALDQQMAELMPALARLFSIADRAYEERKKAQQALDFDDLETLALDLLNDHGPVRERWQREVRAILVDEYQDTNGRQRDLVNLLNGDQGKLFIVGDAKQSIYRFRGAEVAVFRGERRAIVARGGASFDLSQSYRAHRELVQGANDLLRPVLGEEEDPERPWREPFAPLRHTREEPVAGVEQPYVELQLTVGSKESGALRRAADALAAYLADMVETEGSAVRYGDVAILCRASTSFGAYEDALDAAGLPYLTVAGRGFYDRPEIRDLLNALKALADPTDDLALAGLLRSPVMGFSDGDLYDMIQGRDILAKSVSLWGLMQEGVFDGTERARQLIATLHSRAGRISAADLLKEFLDATNYRAALLQAGQQRAARNVSKLLASTQTSGIVSVEATLAYVADLRAGAVREGEARATAGNAIRLMSIHAAKGLEFPVVVIGDINYQRPGQNELLLEPGLGVLPRLRDEGGAGSGLYSLCQARDADQEAAESDRLFYVAATRARDKLILNGCFKLTTAGKPGWLAGWLRQISGPLGLAGRSIEYDESGDQARHFSLQVSQTTVGCTICEPGFEPGRRALTEETGEAFSERWDPRMVAAIDAAEGQVDDNTREREADPPRHVWRVVPAVARPGAPAWLVGKLVHEALANWRFPGEGFEQWVEGRAQSYGLADKTRIAAAARETRRLLAEFRGDGLFQEMDAAEVRHHEIPYDRLGSDGRPEHGIIDVLYRHGGDWVVVDFKTDRIRDEDHLNHVLRDTKYRAQLARYVAAVEALVGERPLARLCFLNYQGGVRIWRDADGR
jgi:ATP-dependent helicase/nuclease subunit A